MNLVHQNRLTLKSEINLTGKGLHSGSPVTVKVGQGENGIYFSDGTDRWEAIPSNVTDTSRSTQIGSIRTVEHLMSALAGSGITDAEILVAGGELPGLDGSAAEFLKAISDAGTVLLGERTFPELFSRVFFLDDAASIGLSAGTGKWKFEFVAGEHWPRSQTYESESILDDYATEIAPARTFAMEEGLPHLARLQLGQGLDETSAVIVGQLGYKNEVRFGDELARHKLLDAIGDIALAGYPLFALNGAMIRSGHRTHVEAAKRLREAWQHAANAHPASAHNEASSPTA